MQSWLDVKDGSSHEKFLVFDCDAGRHFDRLKAVAQAVNSREKSAIPARSFLSCEADVLAV